VGLISRSRSVWGNQIEEIVDTCISLVKLAAMDNGLPDLTEWKTSLCLFNHDAVLQLLGLT
jgi:hypothetical protein